jgi:hypothetical protein
MPKTTDKRCGNCGERVLRELKTGDGRTVCREHNDKPVRSITPACDDHNPLVLIQGMPKQKWEDREKIYRGANKLGGRIY